jgi:hypothetical protein
VEEEEEEEEKKTLRSTESLPSLEYEDSDEESDELIASRRNAEEATSKTSIPRKTITIKDSTYTTYLSVLLWIGTGFIRFAPLKSTYTFPSKAPIAEGGGPQSRAQYLLESISGSKSTLPLPASPKSVYRLAHYLGLEDLTKLALNDLAKKLGPTNVTHELFGDVATNYPEVRQLCLEKMVKNWAAVSTSKTFKAAKARAEAGELDVGLILAVELMKQYGPKG